MADLTDLPDADPAIVLDFQSTLTDVGPDYIDKQTFDRFLELGAGGVLQFSRDPSPELDAVSLEDLTGLFTAHLHGDTPASHFALDHRVYSLMWACRDLIAANDGAAVAGTGLASVDKAIGTLEIWLMQKREAWQVLRAPTSEAGVAREDALFSELSLLKPAEVTWLTGISVNTLAAWRGQNKGPQFCKVSGERSSIRYPAVALVEWLTVNR